MAQTMQVASSGPLTTACHRHLLSLLLLGIAMVVVVVAVIVRLTGSCAEVVVMVTGCPRRSCKLRWWWVMDSE